MRKPSEIVWLLNLQYLADPKRWLADAYDLKIDNRYTSPSAKEEISKKSKKWGAGQPVFPQSLGER